MRISLGLGRGTGAKVAPWVLIALALVPVAVLVVLAAFLGSVPTSPDDFELPSYAEYYEFAIIPLALFAAVVAPLLVCPDRRDGVLSLYAARPITATDYVVSRWFGFFTVAATVACIPEAVLFVWNLLDAHDTGSWIRDNWDVVPRFLASGLGRRRRVHDAGAVRRVVHDPARIRGDRNGGRALHRRRRRRHRPRQLRRARSRDVLSEADVLRSPRRHGALDLRRRDRRRVRARAGSRRSGSRA